MPRRRACPLPALLPAGEAWTTSAPRWCEISAVASRLPSSATMRWEGCISCRRARTVSGRVAASSRAGITAAVLSATSCFYRASARGRERVRGRLLGAVGALADLGGRALDDRRASGGFVGVRDRGYARVLEESYLRTTGAQGLRGDHAHPAVEPDLDHLSLGLPQRIASTGRRFGGDLAAADEDYQLGHLLDLPREAEDLAREVRVSLLQGRHRLRRGGLEERDLRRTRGFQGPDDHDVRARLAEVALHVSCDAPVRVGAGYQGNVHALQAVGDDRLGHPFEHALLLRYLLVLLADLLLLAGELPLDARDLRLHPVAHHAPVGHRDAEQDPDRQRQEDGDERDEVVPEVRHCQMPRRRRSFMASTWKMSAREFEE